MKIQFLDIKGNKISLGDWLKVTGSYSTSFNNSPFCFYVQFKIEEGKAIPFETFSYDRIELVSGPPENIKPNEKGIYFFRYPGEDQKSQEIREYDITRILFQQMKNRFFVITE